VQKPSFLDNYSKSAITWLRDWRNLIIVLLILLSLLLHLGLINLTEEFISDEAFYVPEARSIIHEGELLVPGSPPLGKLFIASGIIVFGDNPWGWRMPSALFATASILILYLISRKLTTKITAILATLLFAFESLAFFFSGIAMLDIFMLTFMLLAFLFYLQNRYVFSGVALALSALCKMTGIFGVFVILFYWLFTKRRESPRTIIFFLSSLVITFMLLMPLLDFATTREWISPLERLADMMLRISLPDPDLVAFATWPWEWITTTPGFRSTTFPSLWVMINPALWILIIPSMSYMIYDYIKNRTNTSLFIVLWFAATFLPWVVIALATGRVTYIYYFVQSIGAVCLAIGILLNRLWEAQRRGQFVKNNSSINLIIRRVFQVIIVGYLTLYALFFMYFWIMAYSY